MPPRGPTAHADEVYKAEMRWTASKGAAGARHVKREPLSGAAKSFPAFLAVRPRLDPDGYRAVWDGLMTELKDTENGSACIAVCEDLQLTDSHKSVYSHALNSGRWFGTTVSVHSPS